jgi:choline-sulfatase
MPTLSASAVPDDPHSRRVRHVIGLGQQTPTEKQTLAARRAYMGAVSYVDDQVGTLLNALEQAGLSEDTIVIVLADHGDMLGERGLWYKMTFFEPACRIPLIVCCPGRFGARRVPDHASLLDLLPTLVDLGGAGQTPDYAAPPDGRSLAPLLKGEAPAADRPREVLGEYLAEGAVAPVVMIRRGRYKFVHSPVDPDQLYDLAADPLERTNLAGSVAAADAVAAFREEIGARWSLSAVHEQVVASQRRRHLVDAALRIGRHVPWDFQPLRDASRMYVRNDQELNDVEALARLPPAPSG